MDINRAGFRKQLPHEQEPVVHHLQIGVGIPSPCIAIRELFENARLLLNFLLTYLSAECEVSTGIEWRVDIDEVDFAGERLYA